MLFGLPFAALGLVALVAGVRRYPAEPNAIVGIIVGGVFTMVGVLLMVGARYGAVSAARTDELKASNPEKPWMWRGDWASGVIKDSNKGSTIGIWIFSVIWCSVCFPVTFLAAPQLKEQKWMSLLILLFPVAGIFLLISAVYQTLRSMKFGTSKCHLDRVPIVPGRTFRGHIEVGRETAPVDGYQVRIACVRSQTTRSGRNRSTTETLLWDAEIMVPPSAAMRSPMGTRIPFELAAPPDAHVTDETDFYDRYEWRLSANAELAGVDYAAQFEVPVFQTGEVADGSDFAVFEQRHRAEAGRREIKPASGVQIMALPGGGAEYRSHAKRTVGSVLQALFFLALWNGAIAAMFYFHAPWGFPAVFIVIDLLLLVSSFDFFLGLATIAVDKTGVRMRKEWLGIGSTKMVEASAIASIDGTTPAPNSKAFALTMTLSDGSKQTLTGYLTDRESADIVAAKMMADLGR